MRVGIGIDYVTVINKMPFGVAPPNVDVRFITQNIGEYVKQLKMQVATRKVRETLDKAKYDIVDGKKADEIIKDTTEKFNSINFLDEDKLVDVGTIDPARYSNRVKVKSEFSNLDKMIGGFSLGELSIWTGKSGQGKSTFLSQLMLNTINQGFKVCAYSGELINEQFQYWIMLQACGSSHLIEKYDDVKQRNVKVPTENAMNYVRNWLKGKIFLYNNEFTDKDNNILDVFKLAHKKFNCQVFLVDNLMTAKYDYNNKDNYYIQQSGFVGELVRFAKTYNVHVHLVAHPKKTQGEITKEDISGTMDITNRADNTFSVNRDEENNTTVVRILKNRSEGIQNMQCAFTFDIDSKRFIPLGSEMSKYKKYGWEKEILF